MKAMLQLMKIRSAWVVESPAEIIFEVGPKVNNSFKYFKTENMTNSHTSTVKKIIEKKYHKIIQTAGATYKITKIK